MIHRTTSVFPAVLVIVVAVGCGQQTPQTSNSDAADIIAAAIEYQGKDAIDRIQIEFDFRGRHFSLYRKDGLFQYERLFSDSTGNVRDVVNNNEVFREINGNRVALDSVKHRSVYVDVNSIAYFALLPYPLGDAAVRSRTLGKATIDSVEYHEVEVTFEQAGGGLDHQDRFVYWIREDPAVIDYLAYYYYTDGGGSRFRKAYNRRRVGGVLFADYYNYSAPVDSMFSDVHVYDRFYMSDSLSLVSEINLVNLRAAPVEE
jgi:hypothetical protein